jgi:hypothetical protein
MNLNTYTVKIARKNRHGLKFSKKGEYITTTGMPLRFVKKVKVSVCLTHYVFKDRKGETYNFKVTTFPYMAPMGLNMVSRDKIGLIKTSDVLWASLAFMGL